MDEGVLLLLRYKQRSDIWKKLFTAMGHVGSFLAQMAKFGKVEEGFPPAKRGVFLYGLTDRFLSAFRPEREAFIFSVMTTYAEAVGNDSRATELALEGLELARRMKLPIVIGALGPKAVAPLLMANKFAEAVDVGLQAATCVVASRDSQSVLSSSTDLMATLGAKPSSGWLMAENQGMMLGVVASVFRLGQMWLDSPPSCRQGVQGVIAACKRLGESAAYPHAWAKASELLEETFLRGVPQWRLRERVHEAGLKQVSAVHVLAYLLTPFAEDAIVDVVAPCQAMALPDVVKLLPADSPMSRRIILPFLSQYWRATFSQQRSRFNSPRLVEGSLNEALAAPEKSRPSAILRAMLDGLGVDYSGWPEDTRKWLQLH